MGIVALRGIEVFGHIGVMKEERTIGRKFIVDVEVHTSLKKVSKSDSVSEVLNYASLSETVLIVMEKEFHLLEAAAGAIGREILENHSDIDHLEVKISKLTPLMRGNIQMAEIRWIYPEDY